MKSARRQTAFLALAPGSVIIPIQSSYGQSQAINGSIRGRVTDPANAPVNVLSGDEQNITSINTTATVTATTGAIVTNPTFAPVSTLLEDRIVQLSVRVDW